MSEKINAIADALVALLDGGRRKAQEILREKYPFQPVERHRRTWTPRRALALFARDGFIDRYSGDRLVFPGALRALSVLVSDAFPAHPNWKMSETHFAYYELFPTIDHVLPVSRGGTDTADNQATTSMLRNQAKAHWTLEELGWSLHPPGDLAEWDGLLALSSRLCSEHSGLLEDDYFRKWHEAARDLSGEVP